MWICVALSFCPDLFLLLNRNELILEENTVGKLREDSGQAAKYKTKVRYWLLKVAAACLCHVSSEYVYMLMSAMLPKSKYFQTQRSCHLISSNDTSIPPCLWSSGEKGWVRGNLGPCNSGDCKGLIKR